MQVLCIVKHIYLKFNSIAANWFSDKIMIPLERKKIVVYSHFIEIPGT